MKLILNKVCIALREKRLFKLHSIINFYFFDIAYLRLCCYLTSCLIRQWEVV